MDKNVPTVQKTVRFKIYPKNEEINEDDTNLFKLRTRGARLVHHMDLNYESISYDCDPTQSKNLQAPLEKLKLLDSLYISFYEAYLKNSMIFQNISAKLKSLSFLQDLSLQFYYSNWVSLEGVIHLTNALAQMKLLKKLTLNLESCEWVNDASLHLVFQSLKRSKNMQSLELDLCNCHNVTEKSFKYLASIFKHSLQPLKGLSLRVSGLNFTKGYPLDFLAAGLARLKYLQKLRIDFSSLKVPQGIDFSSFMLSIKHLESLTILSLDFSFLSLSVTALKDLAKSFTSLTRLHTVALSFRWGEAFGGLTTEALSQCLQSLPSLKNLTLEFRYSQSVYDHALEKLSTGLKVLTNLSEITLLCDNCLYIGDAGVASVASVLGSLTNLRTVILGFRGCRPVKNIHYESLNMNKNVKHLIFNYNNS